MPGKDGTGPLGLGPCGRHGCECRKKLEGKKKKPDGMPDSPGNGSHTFNRT